MIRFACPRCGKNLKSRDEGAGKQTRCPMCTQLLIVPRQEDVEPPTGANQSQSEFVDVGTCPTCKASVRVPPGMLGRWVECPKCGSGFAATDNAGEDSTSFDVSDSYEEQEQPQAKQGLPPLLIALLVMSVVALPVLIVLITLTSRDDQVAKQDVRPKVTIREKLRQFEDEQRPPRDREQPSVLPDAAGLGGLFCFLWLIGLAYFIGLILLLAWVARDARNRCVDGGAVWVLLILFTHWIGLIIYLASRPHGMLVECSCGNKRLAHAKLCPHCGRK